MTTEKAIKLIKNDIEYYEKQITRTSEFVNDFRKKPHLDGSTVVGKNMVEEIIQMMCEAMKTSDKSQIEYYKDILTELESKKKQ